MLDPLAHAGANAHDGGVHTVVQCGALGATGALEGVALEGVALGGRLSQARCLVALALANTAMFEGSRALLVEHDALEPGSSAGGSAGCSEGVVKG